MPSVSLKNITKRFGKTLVIPKLNLEIPSNELTVFVGPSGCGKSTLLRIIAGLEMPTSGDVLISGKCVNDIPPFKRGVAMVFQSYALYPHMTVYQNMSFGLSSLKLPKSEIDSRIKRASETLGLDPYLKRKPKQLSGGQRQRVAMGRALVRQPEVFLFDEPLSNLDAALRVKMRVEIARLREELNGTMIYVTHDQVEAMTLANQIVVLREGQIEQQGTPMEVYHQPKNKFVASFLGSPSMNFVPAKQSSPTAITLPNGTVVEIPKSEYVSEFGIRPEHLTIDRETQHQIKGNVFATEQLGDHVLAHITLGKTDTLVAKLPGEAKIQPHQEICLGFDPKHIHLFDKDEKAIAHHT